MTVFAAAISSRPSPDRAGAGRPGPADITTPLGPALDRELFRQLTEVARTAGIVEWSRRYADIVGAWEHARATRPS